MDDSDIIDNFQIYRPPLCHSRLVPTYIPPKSDEWRPSLSYKYKLKDIKNQFTPAEHYLHRLKTSGPYIRLIQRLESRWSKNYDAYVASSIKIQSLYRAVVDRQYFEKLKIEMHDEMLRRKCIPLARELFLNNDFGRVVQEIQSLPLPLCVPLELLAIKSYYRLAAYDYCIRQCHSLQFLAECVIDSYYYEACSLSQLNRLIEAYEVTRRATIKYNTFATKRLYQLNATLAISQSSPPFYEVAIDSFTAIIKLEKEEHPAGGGGDRDYDIYLARAGCYACLQEWSDALSDLSFILAFQPQHIPSLLLRARVYACLRQWEKAKDDYDLILYHHHPHHGGCVEAVEGLKEIMKFDPVHALDVES